MNDFKPKTKFTWSRRVKDESLGYEVSSYGDKRFSALNARLSDGRSIEEAYQLDVKGYRNLGSDWRLGKGKPPMIPSNDLPKVTSHYFELKNDRYNIFKELIDISNCCSKIIATESRSKSIKDFIRIVKSEHSDKVNSMNYDSEDIVLVLFDPTTQDINECMYQSAIESISAAGTIGIKAFVVPNGDNSLVGTTNLFQNLKELVYPRYTNIPGTNYFINLYEQYRNLWAQWALENISLIEDLAVKANGKILTDIYATTEISQARALADILNKFYNL